MLTHVQEHSCEQLLKLQSKLSQEEFQHTSSTDCIHEPRLVRPTSHTSTNGGECMTISNAIQQLGHCQNGHKQIQGGLKGTANSLAQK